MSSPDAYTATIKAPHNKSHRKTMAFIFGLTRLISGELTVLKHRRALLYKSLHTLCSVRKCKTTLERMTLKA